MGSKDFISYGLEETFRCTVLHYFYKSNNVTKFSLLTERVGSQGLNIS